VVGQVAYHSHILFSNTFKYRPPLSGPPLRAEFVLDGTKDGETVKVTFPDLRRQGLSSYRFEFPACCDSDVGEDFGHHKLLVDRRKHLQNVP
jgi:hypothetical protein